MDKERGYDCIDVMRGIADKRKVSVAQVALSWLLHQKAVTSVIIGAKKIEQLDDNIGATEVTLNDDELAALDKVSALLPEYPGWMFERQGRVPTQAGCRRQNTLIPTKKQHGRAPVKGVRFFVQRMPKG